MTQTLTPPPAASAPKPEQGPELPPFSIQPQGASEVGLPDPSVAAESADQPKDRSPIQFMGGMLYDQAKNGNTLSYIQSTGRATLAPLPSRDTRGMPWRNRVHTAQGEEVVFAPKALLRTAEEETKAITSLAQEARAEEVIDAVQNQPKVTLIGQSADAQPAVIAVHRRPDLFKNLILAFPSGIFKKQHRTEYLREAASDIAGRKDKPPKTVIEPENNFDAPMPASKRRLGKLMMRRFVGSGGFRALSSTMSGYQGGLLHELRQKEGAPGVSMVLGTEDAVGRPSRILESMKSADDVDFMLIVNSTHGIQGRKDLADKMLELTDMMEARSRERKAAKDRGEKFDPGPLADRLIFLEDEAYRVSQKEQERLKALASAVPA